MATKSKESEAWDIVTAGGTDTPQRKQKLLWEVHYGSLGTLGARGHLSRACHRGALG